MRELGSEQDCPIERLVDLSTGYGGFAIEIRVAAGRYGRSHVCIQNAVQSRFRQPQPDEDGNALTFSSPGTRLQH